MREYKCMWNVSILSKLSTTMRLLANELHCSAKWALTLCGPHHLGLRGGWDLMHRSSLATMNMECFPTIPVGLILLGWPFSSSWRGEALSKEHPHPWALSFFYVQPFCSLSLSRGTRGEIQSRDPQSSSATGLQQFKPWRAGNSQRSSQEHILHVSWSSSRIWEGLEAEPRAGKY